MKHFLLMLLVCLAPLSGFCSEGAALFAEAKTVSKSDPLKARKLFQLSGLKFEALAESRPELKADALYNAGNAYFFAEERGRALHAYRRAEQVLPFNRELKDNIAYLVQLSGGEVAVNKEVSLWQKLRIIFSLRVRMLLLMVFYLLAVTAVVVWQWRAKLNVAILAAFCGLSLIFSLSVLITFLGGPRNGVVLSYQTQARKGDGYIYEPAFGRPLAEASEFSISKIRGDWVLAKLPDGNQGWVPASEVGLW
ncbi:hypothetical protein ACFLQY_00940 [Verrucomicrobiota bacterium]